MNHWYLLVLLAGLGVFGSTAHADPPFRDGTTWCGDPEAVQSPDNPYVQLAERNVDRSLKQKTEPFWLAWGLAAPESRRNGDPTLKAEVLAAYNKLVPELVAKKMAYWELLSTLEAMRLLRRSEDFPADDVVRWLKELRVCVENNYHINTTSTGWETRAPNTQHQSAAILQLASILYEEKRYADLAASLVKKTAPLINADGAFPYLPNSGPSLLYFGFDATFLGRYYQLSRDPLARELLIKMARYAQDALPNGLLESSSAPWWKHAFSNGGPMHGVEIVAGLSRDPTTRALAQYRLQSGQPYYFSYYAQFFWDDTIPLGQLGQDLCRHNGNFAGPQLRSGKWQVVMPGLGMSDTFIGATLAGGELYKFQGELVAVSLAVLDKGVTDPAARPGSVVVAAPDDLKTVSLVGDGWIASAAMYSPRPLYFGDPKPPEARPWYIAQVWFADKQSLAGWAQATATADTGAINGPLGVLQVGLPLTIDGKAVRTGTMALNVFGGQVGNVTADKSGKRALIQCTDTGERRYQPGERWGFGLTAAADPASIGPVDATAGDIVHVHITRPGGKVVLLLNTATAAATVEPPAGSIWRATRRGVKAATPSPPAKSIPIAPGELIVITP